MIRIFTFMVIFITINDSVFCQYPPYLKTGLYNSLMDLLNNNPKSEGKLSVKHRTETDIILWGGNDYKVNIDTLNINKSIINKCFAVFDGDSLFINGKYINGSSPFCKVENNGRFFVIKAGIPSMSKRKSVGYKNSMAQIDYIPVGGAIGGASTGAQLAMVRLNYILDCKNGNVKILTKDYLSTILKDYPDLNSEFELIKDPENQTLVEYMDRINEK